MRVTFRSIPRNFALRGLRFNSSASASSQVLTPVEQYDEDVKNGLIRSDDWQRKMLKSLNSVHEELLTYNPIDVPKKTGSFLSSFFAKKTSADSFYGPRGIYMYGEVGSGKTMLMDMFYRTVPKHLTKRRIHFHGFMQDVHKRVHALKRKGHKEGITDIIAREEASAFRVLCFDEMQVTDVADAMILRGLLESLYKHGVVTFYTSNREPDELYKHGVQRESFIPCIELMKERNHVVQLVSPTDYRKLPRPSSGSYLFRDPEQPKQQFIAAAKEHAEKWFDYFADGEPVSENRELTIWGRSVRIPRSAGNNVMKFTFDELCGTPRSAADYLEMCRTFKSAVITDIPEISLEQRDILRRFITFLDAAYDSHINFAACAWKPWETLFNTKHLTIDPHTHQVKLQGESNEVMDVSNFAGHEEMFAFARALSRLKQMGSASWQQ